LTGSGSRGLSKADALRDGLSKIRLFDLTIMMKGTIVRKTSFEEEQRMKDEQFLCLTPAERLSIHEQLRKRIWGPLYNKVKLRFEGH
jgi:hypothetical protein